jgi:starch-binding outer membrane protein, SusD/RagB family
MKIKIFMILLIIAFVAMSCSDSFLDTEPLTEQVDENYYQTPDDADAALTACYSVLTLVPVNESFMLVSNLMSDDQFGGGGENDQSVHATDCFKKYGDDMYENAWTVYYKGIFRCNMLISKLDQITWDSDDQRDQAEGEARFLRAYFYFDMARMWGTVPLVTTTDPLNLPKATASEIFAQIATDLKLAIEKLPATSLAQISTTELGHATRWAAEGLMARAFLFYTGYYSQSTLPLTDGSTIAKSDVIGWIDECANTALSGHGLISDFRNLWPYAYVNKNYTYSDGSPQYAYAYNNDLSWIGEEGANVETVFAIKFSNLASWSTSIYYSNQFDLYCGFRNQTLVPFGQGWGCGTVNSQLWDDWESDEPNDIRRQGSILDVSDDSEGLTGYTWGSDKQYHETGYWQKKYMPVNVEVDGTIENYSCVVYGTTANYQLDNTQDLVMIRFPDILLMGAELEYDGSGSYAQTYLDRVRARAGLSSVTATLENIKKERRYELAFEGLRYWDLLRWHDEETAFAKVKDVTVKNNSVSTTKTITYRSETGGFLPIPETEITLSSGVLVQNDGWTDASSNYSSGTDQ